MVMKKIYIRPEIETLNIDAICLMGQSMYDVHTDDPQDPENALSKNSYFWPDEKNYEKVNLKISLRPILDDSLGIKYLDNYY